MAQATNTMLRRSVELLLLVMLTISCNGQVNVNAVVQDWTTDKSNASVDLDEFMTLLKRDGIVPIDRPRFMKATQDTIYKVRLL